MIHNQEDGRSGAFLLYRVFAWMAMGVGVSGATAVLVAQNPLILYRYSFVLPLLLIGQLILVVTLSWRIATLSYAVARIMFLVYSIMSGMTLSVIFIHYTTASIAQVFFIAASMFATMAIYGAFTKTNLAQWRNILYMALFGLVIAMAVNIFFHSSVIDYVTAVVGVLLFSALTAYDIQNIQMLATHLSARDEDWNKIALIGALQLYLDFINLFLSLLRLFGKRQD